MTAYIANHQKKLRIFAKREQELLHAINHAFSQEKLFRAAEKVRDAKIRVFKCRFAQNSPNQPHDFSPEVIAAQNRALREWLSMSAKEIVDKYRSHERGPERT